MPETPQASRLEPFLHALETMAFISPLPAEAGALPPEDARLVEMQFACPRRGTARLVAGGAFGALLASNMLGVEPDSAEATQAAEDALRELLNIACGEVVRRIGVVEGDRLHMSLPTSAPFDAAGRWSSFLNMPGVIALNADGHTIAFQLSGAERT